MKLSKIMLWINLTQLSLNDYYFNDNNYNDYKSLVNNDVEHREIDDNDDHGSLLNCIFSM